MKKRKMAFGKKVVVTYLAVLAFFAISIIILSYLCVIKEFTGSLGFIAYPFTALSAAGAIILPAYLSKSAKKNTQGGITYEAAKAKNFEESI